MARLEALQGRIVTGDEFFGRDRIQGLPNVIVTRDLFQVKQALGIAQSLGLLHRLLARQEGGALGKEDRKGAQANVLHGILGIVAGAAVGQPAQDPAQVPQVLIPAFEDLGAHAVNLPWASALRALR